MVDAKVCSELKCYHCGQECNETLWLSEKPFCCYGCKTVFEILHANDLCEYYAFDQNPGNHTVAVDKDSFAYLDETNVRKKVLAFDSENFAKVQFYIPGIHCISCIWLLENLHKISGGILKSEVNFARKLVTIEFDPVKIYLSKIADTLSEIGYTPQINLDSQNAVNTKVDKTLVLKLAVAGFCFGNVMLFSFPEYLGLDQSDEKLRQTFSWLNLLLSIPVLFFSGIDYLRAAWRSFKEKQINIEVPIAVGLIALFGRSIYDILTGTGPGYLDSFSGLVFFLLIGRWFQGKTYESLAFDRDFTSYFPLAVNRWAQNQWAPVVIYELQPGDKIRIRNMEIIPADSKLLDAEAYVDYSFVTGEARPVKVKRAEVVYAGGRLIGTPVTLAVEKQTSQSHLTSLWNNEAFKKITESKYRKTIDLAARRFTWIVLLLAFSTLLYWQINEPGQMWLVLTSVLMVACPCALALAAPFTFGSMLRVLGINKLYLKNSDVIEKLAHVDTVVFDKTGTVTHGNKPEITFNGKLNSLQLGRVKLLTGYSTHPLSSLIFQSIAFLSEEVVSDFKEVSGKGIQGTINGYSIKVGSAQFVGSCSQVSPLASHVFVSINDEVCGYFSIKTSIRPNLGLMLKKLQRKDICLLSGDNESDKNLMRTLFGSTAKLLFNQSPHDKLNYIQHLQRNGKKVLMIGDGLNDAGALKQSDVGLAITDDTGIFTPACDGILLGKNLAMLHNYLNLARSSSIILKTGFAISFSYNAIALTFAASGHLTPLVAAILMPISSISVVGFSSMAVRVAAKRKFKTL
ncbi:MAG TPA: heavy metal translocating P-type ATPase metal-binding domain-containing protein [Chryseolinea sp.]